MIARVWKRILTLAAVMGLIVGSIGRNVMEARAEELEKRVYKVGYVQDRRPVSYMNESGELGGITRYILDRVSELSGVEFEYVALPTGAVTYDYLLSEGFDLVTSVEYNEENKRARGILISDPYLSSQKVIVAREGVEFSYNANLRVAVSTGSQTLKTVLGRIFPNFELVDYDSMEACLNAMKRGEADLLIQNQYVAEYWLYRPSYESMKVIPIMGLEDRLCFSAVVPLEHTDDSPEWRQKELLIERLDDAISRMTEDETAMYIIEGTMESQYRFTTGDMLYRYRYPAMALAAAFILIVVLFLLLLRARLRSMEDRADARAKGRFLSTMSHEIRTPLNGLVGLNYLMAQNMDDREKIESYLKQSTATAKYLMSLVNDILDMSRLQEATMELESSQVNLRLLASTSASIVRGGMGEKGINFRIDVELPYPGVLGDQVRIQQILLNLLDNAKKFTPVGGNVDFTARQELKDNETVLTVFTVRDTGIGMSEEFQKHIFDTFTREMETVSKGNQGTGLGMAISHSLAKLMGGDLTVSSRKGEGSEFTFSFPAPLAIADAESTEWEKKAEQEAEEQTGFADKDQPLRVLVAEDNELNAEILMELLEDAGAAADLAVNGREAVEKFARSPVGTYRLILMDLLMPEMDGFMAAKTIRTMKRKDAAEVKIFACTANSYKEDRDKAIESGMDDFITKPIDIGALLERLEKLS